MSLFLRVPNSSLQGIAERPLPCNLLRDPVCHRPFTAQTRVQIPPGTPSCQRLTGESSTLGSPNITPQNSSQSLFVRKHAFECIRQPLGCRRGETNSRRGRCGSPQFSFAVHFKRITARFKCTLESTLIIGIEKGLSAHQCCSKSRDPNCRRLWT
jgi:hypothetical protein